MIIAFKVTERLFVVLSRPQLTSNDRIKLHVARTANAASQPTPVHPVAVARWGRLELWHAAATIPQLDRVAQMAHFARQDTIAARTISVSAGQRPKTVALDAHKIKCLAASTRPTATIQSLRRAAQMVSAHVHSAGTVMGSSALSVLTLHPLR